MSDYEIDQLHSRSNFHVVTIVEDGDSLYVLLAGNSANNGEGMIPTLAIESTDVTRELTPVSVSEAASRQDRLIVGRWRTGRGGSPADLHVVLKNREETLLQVRARRRNTD